MTLAKVPLRHILHPNRQYTLRKTPRFHHLLANPAYTFEETSVGLDKPFQRSQLLCLANFQAEFLGLCRGYQDLGPCLECLQTFKVTSSPFARRKQKLQHRRSTPRKLAGSSSSLPRRHRCQGRRSYACLQSAVVL